MCVFPYIHKFTPRSIILFVKRLGKLFNLQNSFGDYIIFLFFESKIMFLLLLILFPFPLFSLFFSPFSFFSLVFSFPFFSTFSFSLFFLEFSFFLELSFFLEFSSPLPEGGGGSKIILPYCNVVEPFHCLMVCVISGDSFNLSSHSTFKVRHSDTSVCITNWENHAFVLYIFYLVSTLPSPTGISRNES